jgi:hypothetical protein
MLVWHDRVWLIDHGAAFYRQHAEAPLASTALLAFPLIRDHVLLEVAGPIAAADERLAAMAAAAVPAVVELMPDTWLGGSPDERRADFAAFLERRLRPPRVFVEEAERARA